MSAKQYPSGNRISFLVCESLRPELNGKAALLGVYVGGDMLISNDAPADVVLPLAIFWAFEDGEGEFTWRGKLLDPQGNSIAEVTGDPLVKPKDKNGTLGLVLPFKPSSDGRYTIQVTLDDRVYERSFGCARGALAK